LYVGKMGMGQVTNRSIVIPRLEDPSSASPDERDEHLMLLEAARHSLDVEFIKTLAAADSAGDHHLSGHPSTVSYLKDRLGIAPHRANSYLKTAQEALAHPATFSAWSHRQMTSDEAALLFRAAAADPDRYQKAETVLLELVGEGFEETRRTLDYWRNRVDPEGVRLELADQLQRRHFEISRRANGMVWGEFSLPTLAGETLLSALDALMPPPAPEDPRSTSQRRADALEDLGRSFLEGSQSPVVGGERPHINVHVDVDAMHHRLGGLHETEDGIVLDADSLRTLCCDCSLSRIVFGAGSEILDVGRKTRVVSAGLRRAVIARDRHCVWPGCDRSSRWCDVHHLVPWSEGGETDIANLCLLCRYHHSLTHLEIEPHEEARVLAGSGSSRSP
jgi:hypothetical protein